MPVCARNLRLRSARIGTALTRHSLMRLLCFIGLTELCRATAGSGVPTWTNETWRSYYNRVEDGGCPDTCAPNGVDGSVHPCTNWLETCAFLEDKGCDCAGCVSCECIDCDGRPCNGYFDLLSDGVCHDGTFASRYDSLHNFNCARFAFDDQDCCLADCSGARDCTFDSGHSFLGDGVCDSGERGRDHNCAALDWDGGDCCEAPCGGFCNRDDPSECSDSCVDCDGRPCGDLLRSTVGDGNCNDGGADGELNFKCPAMDWDGGDCNCVDCSGRDCNGFHHLVQDLNCDNGHRGTFNFSCEAHDMDGGDCQISDSSVVLGIFIGVEAIAFAILFWLIAQVCQACARSREARRRLQADDAMQTWVLALTEHAVTDPKTECEAIFNDANMCGSTQQSRVFAFLEKKGLHKAKAKWIAWFLFDCGYRGEFEAYAMANYAQTLQRAWGVEAALEFSWMKSDLERLPVLMQLLFVQDDRMGHYDEAIAAVRQGQIISVAPATHPPKRGTLPMHDIKKTRSAAALWTENWTERADVAASEYLYLHLAVACRWENWKTQLRVVRLIIDSIPNLTTRKRARIADLDGAPQTALDFGLAHFVAPEVIGAIVEADSSLMDSFSFDGLHTLVAHGNQTSGCLPSLFKQLCGRRLATAAESVAASHAEKGSGLSAAFEFVPPYLKAADLRNFVRKGIEPLLRDPQQAENREGEEAGLRQSPVVHTGSPSDPHLDVNSHAMLLTVPKPWPRHALNDKTKSTRQKQVLPHLPADEAVERFGPVLNFEEMKKNCLVPLVDVLQSFLDQEGQLLAARRSTLQEMVQKAAAGFETIYDKVAEKFTRGDIDGDGVNDLDSLDKAANAIHANIKQQGYVAQQPETDILELFRLCSRVTDRFNTFLADVIQKCGALPSSGPAPMKHLYRAMEKLAWPSCGPRWNASRLLDIVRGAIIFDSVPQILKCLNHIRSRDDVTIYRIKNRFAEGKAAAGWRDCMINVQLRNVSPPVICEVQLIHSKLMVAREGLAGHTDYVFFRTAKEILEWSSRKQSEGGIMVQHDATAK